MATLVPCHLSHVVIDEDADQQTIYVSERSGHRRFPIAIGQMEALAIDRAVKGQEFPRPLTHDLLVGIIEAQQGHLAEVRITDVRDGTFFAELVLARADGGACTVDCRPSDALAVMVRRPGTPLLVAEHVLEEAAG